MFTYICIEFDLYEPIVKKVWLNDYWYKGEYEELHIICSSCGRYMYHGISYMYMQRKSQSEMIIQLENHVNNDRDEINVDGHLVEQVMVTD